MPHVPLEIGFVFSRLGACSIPLTPFRQSICPYGCGRAIGLVWRNSFSCRPLTGAPNAIDRVSGPTTDYRLPTTDYRLPFLGFGAMRVSPHSLFLSGPPSAGRPAGILYHRERRKATVIRKCDDVVRFINTGRFLIVWRSHQQEGGGKDLFGRRYDSNGLPLADEFRINDDTVSEDTSPSPIVAVRAGGTFVAVWESLGPDGSRNGVFLQTCGPDEPRTPLTTENPFLTTEHTEDPGDPARPRCARSQPEDVLTRRHQDTKKNASQVAALRSRLSASWLWGLV
jgi:hypothetical protein